MDQVGRGNHVKKPSSKLISALESIDNTKRTNPSTKNSKYINEIKDTNTNKNCNNKIRSVQNPEEPKQQQALNHPHQYDEAVGVGIVNTQLLESDVSNNDSKKDDKLYASMPSLQTKSRETMEQNQRLHLNQDDDSSEISSSDDDIEECSVGDNDKKSNEKQVDSERDASNTSTNADSAKRNDDQIQAAKDSYKEKCAPASKRRKLNKSCERATWDSHIKLAIANGIIDPSKSFVDKNGKPIPPGKAVMCEACNWAKNEHDKKYLMLRRPYYDSSWLDHTSTLTHIDKEAEFFERRTGCVGSQQMIGKFLTITKSKQVKDYASHANLLQAIHSDDPAGESQQEDDSEQGETVPHENLSRTRVRLSHPSDKKRLSNLQCFLREQIEFFAATEEDVNTYSRGRNKNVGVGQVGIRCVHCSILSIKDRSKGSTYFPSTLSGIYQAAQNMYHYHFCTSCPTLAETCKAQLDEDLSCRSCYGGGKEYWSMSAEHKGLIETLVGLRFKNDCSTHSTDNLYNGIHESSLRQLEIAMKDTANIVSLKDKKLTTDYIFMLFSQMSLCDSEQTSRKDKLPGLVCKHCSGHNESGEFFRKKVSSLSKNENLAQIDKHLNECQSCSDEIKVALKQFKEIHSYQMRHLKRGDKKTFFTKIMTRIYANSPSS